ncbi:MAG: M28 family peptidase [Lewinellaceae bacterium]|nr:M28 family peptidase [Lewinellaceae bacterium]
MKYVILIAALLVTIGQLPAQNARPSVQNLVVVPNWNSQSMDINYDVSDAENDPLEVWVEVSDDGGNSYQAGNTLLFSGDIGFPVQAGSNKLITADISALAGMAGANWTLRLTAIDHAPFDPAELVAMVDSNRMRNDLLFVEGIRHHATGAAHLMEVRDSLIHLFEENDLASGNQYFPFGGFTGWNVWGTMVGSQSADTTVIIDAHFDAVSNAPGADDNGSGVVGVMEASRVMSAFPSRRNVRFIGFDLEESGLIGSKRYISDGLAAATELAGVFNFEMIGYYSNEPNSQMLPAGFNLLFPAAYTAIQNDGFRGNFVTNVANTASSTLADIYSNAAAQYVPGLKVITLKAPGNSQSVPDLRRSDHAPFWDAGYQALMLTDGADFRNLCYHTPNDTFGNKLNMTFMSQITQTTIVAAAQVAGLQHGDWAKADFSSPVSTHTADACAISVVGIGPNGKNLRLESGAACGFAKGLIELFDVHGRSIYATPFTLNTGSTTTITLPQSTPGGIYFVQLSSTVTRQVQKIYIP